MKKIICSILIAFSFIGIQVVKAQNISNEGTDFWAVFPTHVPSGSNFANMSIFISSKNNSSGVVSVGFTVIPFTVLANSVTEISIPRISAYINDNEVDKVLTNRGIRVLVNEGEAKISVYAHIYARARSEAYLVLPVEAHGKKYYAMSTSGLSAPNQSGTGLPGMEFITILANADHTKILLKRKNSISPESILLPKKGDVYQILGSDLTGTSIEIDEPPTSCKTFAVYSGHSGIALSQGSYDPLAQQLYPLNSWGRVYGIVPFIDRNYFAKILASEDNTEVKVNGSFYGNINAGESLVIDHDAKFSLVSANKPISVAQFTFSQDEISATGSNLNGDPEMVILNPIEYNIKNITVFSSNLENITNKYINVFMKTASTSSFKINGLVPAENWIPVVNDPSYSYIQMEVFRKSLTLTANDGFNAIAYGFGDHESYAYSAGTNLATNQFLLLKNKVTNQETIAACLDQASDLRLTLPYQLSRLVWKDESGTIIFDDINPAPETKVVNGQTLYVYTAPVGMVFNTIRIYKLAATATVVSSECFSGDLELNFNIDVDPLPFADFTVNPEGCANQEIAFSDKSSSRVQQKQLTKWLWDFGDGTTSTEQNPKHTFANSGKYTVTLVVGAENGCLSDVAAFDVTINPVVTAAFKTNQTTCINTSISFIDESTAQTGATIKKWLWDMGDGKGIVERLDNSTFNYTYAAAADYTVTLIVQSDKDCKSLPFSLIVKVTDLPKASFTTPEVCLDDAQAVFLNKSLDYDATTNNLTYLWDFGEPASGSFNKSTAKDGKHKYAAAGNYIVSLTVFNANGCTSITERIGFTVNSSNPIAAFQVLNPEELCSNQIFKLKNISTVPGIGNLTRLEWYFDGVLEYTDEDPIVDKIYEFKKPESFSPRAISITLKVFTGDANSCSNTSAPQIVTLLASPSVVFNTPNPICLNGSTIQLIATELGGLTGSFTFTGNGVSQNGIFNPEIAGVGKHTITSKFNSTNGCADSKTQEIEVYPVPIVSAGDDKYILAGGEKMLEATAKGVGLTYKWSPSTGLDRDDILNPIVKPEKDMIYTLTVTSNQGCVITDKVYVYVLEGVNAPNSFTPNGDGINDVWNIKYLETYPKATVEVFSRNGERVFFSKGYSVPFDGNYRNSALPIGTYYYIINPNNTRKRITGNLTIIR
ncbi:MAG: PKD domain-containing protein [Pedobacter sp.]|nr:MAG: PKD domain-containing protein [Pedobacter sp.]